MLITFLYKFKNVGYKNINKKLRLWQNISICVYYQLGYNVILLRYKYLTLIIITVWIDNF